MLINWCYFSYFLLPQLKKCILLKRMHSENWIWHQPLNSDRYSYNWFQRLDSACREKQIRLTCPKRNYWRLSQLQQLQRGKKTLIKRGCFSCESVPERHRVMTVWTPGLRVKVYELHTQLFMEWRQSMQKKKEKKEKVGVGEERPKCRHASLLFFFSTH